ncbi:DUF58 domain-containing protein [Anatilimnocola sp. NA78]|uniref:DUF58 domain-containing protein n=1 Tax=Anatilimnocola sp. NA78 TaxID=3415683 RepID=UPI003CE51441
MKPLAPSPETLDRQLEIAVCRLADDLRFGQDASPYAGSGIEYRQSRVFVDGDSVRDIDWRVTARTGRFHVKEYEALKSMPAYLVVDTSASMVASSIPLSKHKLAALLAGGLALAAMRRLSPVGLIAAGSRQLHSEPTLMRGRVFQWLHALRKAGVQESTMLAQRLDQLEELAPSRTLIIVLSDLHDPGAVPAIKRLAQRHDMLVLQLQDPAERGNLRGGMFHAIEAETGHPFVAHGRSRWFDHPQQQASKPLTAAAIDHLLLATDRPFVPALRRLLSDRGGLVRNTR